MQIIKKIILVLFFITLTNFLSGEKEKNTSDLVQFILNIGKNNLKKFNSPVGIALDKNGNLYVSDLGNCAIKKYNSKLELVKQWGKYGKNQGEMNLPAEIVIYKDFLYVAELGNHRIQKFSLDGESVAIIGENILNHPRAVAISDHEEIFVADEFNSRIVKFDALGNFLYSWGKEGDKPGEFKYPNSLAIGNGKLFVSDTHNHRIQVFSLNGEMLAVFGSLGTDKNAFNYPRGIFIDPKTGLIYIADSFNLRFTVYNSEFKFVKQSKTPLLGINKVITSPSGLLYGTETGIHTVKLLSHNFSVLKTISPKRRGVGELNYPSSIYVQDQLIFVADTLNHKIQVFNKAGLFLTQFGKFGNGAGQFISPRGITLDAQKNIWVADTFNHRIQQFSPQGEFIKEFGQYGKGKGEFNQPMDIQFGPDQSIYVVDSGNHRIQKFSGDLNFIKSFGSFGSGKKQFNLPRRIFITSDSLLYITDMNNHRVQKFSLDGQWLGEFGQYGQKPGELFLPEGIFQFEKKYIIISECGNMRLSVFDLKGKYLFSLGSLGGGDGNFFFPSSIFIHENELFVSSAVLNKIQRFELTEKFKQLVHKKSEKH